MAMPIINTQPAGQTVNAGATATFRVAVALPAGAAGGLTYQWQLRAHGAANFTDIAGATAAAYTTPALAAGDNGAVYRVRVTNAADTVDSAEALLTVQAAAAAGGARGGAGAGGGATPPAGATPTTVNVNVAGAGSGNAAQNADPTWPAGHGHVVTHVAAPRSFMTTNGEKSLLIAVIVLLVIGSAFVTWVVTSRNAPIPPKVMTCVSMCTEMRVAAGENVDKAKAACEQICAPPPAFAPVPPAPQPVQPPTASQVPAASAGDDIAACIVDLMSSGAKLKDAEKYCR